MLRVYLSGHLAVDAPGGRLEASSLPGRQGREVFCFLVINRESAYRCLMRAHAAAGNSAEALRVYERAAR